MVSRSEVDLLDIRAEYKRMYGKSLYADITVSLRAVVFPVHLPKDACGSLGSFIQCVMKVPSMLSPFMFLWFLTWRCSLVVLTRRPGKIVKDIGCLLAILPSKYIVFLAISHRGSTSRSFLQASYSQMKMALCTVLHDTSYVQT